MLDNFFLFGDVPANAASSSYSLPAVFLSYVIASVAAYTALTAAAEGIKAREKSLRILLYFAGTFSLGSGIWSMHFIGMLAYKMAMPMTYDPWMTALSMVIAMVAAGGVMYLTLQHKMNRRGLAAAALLLGAAICGMHYSGMAAMQMENMQLRYIPSLFILSVIIAVAASGAALVIFSRLVVLGAGRRRHILKVLAGLVMGVAVSGMHYTGMYAAVFTPTIDMCIVYPPRDSSADDMLVLSIVAVSSLIFGISLAISLYQGAGKNSVTNDAFPAQLLYVSLALTLITMAWMGVVSFNIHESVTHDVQDGFKLSKIVDRVLELDSILTQSARMAVVTGEKKWENRYNDHAAELDRVIADLYASHLDNDESDEIRLTDAANQKLIVLETMVFTLARKGKRDKALAILNGEEYAKFKQQYGDSTRQLDKEINAIAQARLLLWEGRAHAMLYPILSLSVALIVVWFFSVRSIRVWRRQLLNAKQDAENSNRYKGEFLANMSHELRTPMNGIIGLTRLLSESSLYPEQKESVTAVLQSSETLLHLLNDILDLSKIQAGELLLESAPFNLKDSLRSVINLLAPMASKKGLVLDCVFSPGIHVDVIGDPMRINQIVTNLIGNALKFTEKGTITLTVSTGPAEEAGQKTYTFIVEDTGIGMSEEVQRKLFTKFSQGDASTSRKYGGTGLGLAITKMLVDRMNGSITCVSREKIGTVFIVKIPLATTSQQEVTGTSALKLGFGDTRARVRFSNASILVVDDHPVNLLFAGKLLRKMGFDQVDEAVNGLDALLKIESKLGEPYDIVLMDCQMPKMDGFETTRRLRDIEAGTGQKRMPIIAMTANAMEGDRQHCMQVGMDDYISKPVNPDKLHEVLSRWLADVGHAPGKMTETKDAPPTSEKNDIIDLRHLELFTEGDLDQEKMLSDIFLKVGAESIEVLRAHQDLVDGSESWRHAAHKLKGSSAQIGAHSLCAQCLKAEQECLSSPIAKKNMLADIEKGFALVKGFFQQRQR